MGKLAGLAMGLASIAVFCAFAWVAIEGLIGVARRVQEWAKKR